MNHHSPRGREKHHNTVDASKKTGTQLRVVVTYHTTSSFEIVS